MTLGYSKHKKINHWVLVYSRTPAIKMDGEKRVHEYLTLRDSEGAEFYAVNNSTEVRGPFNLYRLYGQIRTMSDIKKKLIKAHPPI